MKTGKVTALIAGVLLLGLAAQPALAENTATSTASTTTSIEDSLNQLMAAKEDQSFSPKERTFSEVQARENILSGVLVLSAGEVDSMQQKMADLPVFSKGSKELSLQKKYSAQLNDFSGFFAKESKSLNYIKNYRDQYSENTNDSLKNLAQEIENYRDSYYNQSMNDILNFYLIYYNQEIISSATAQLNNVSSSIRQLEASNEVSQGEFDNQLKEINTLLQSAADLTSAAKNMILNPSPAPEAESAASSTVATPSSLLTQSLSDVKQAYNIFLGIGTQLKTVYFGK